MIGIYSTSVAQQMRGDGSYQFMNRKISPVFTPADLISQPSKGESASVTMKAPCADTLLFEDFQSQLIPAAWSNIDLDGNNDINGRPLDWHITLDDQTTVPGDTNYVASSSSWFSPAGRANNWLIITTPLAPCATTVLDWWSAPFEGPAYMDGYKVLVSTTGTNTTDFTDTIFVVAEDISSAGAGTPGPGNVHTNFNGSRGVLQNWQASLSAYDGMTIYVAFVHDAEDDNLIQIDNIFAGVMPVYDLSIDSLNKGTEYAMTPLSQTQPMTFSANLASAGTGSVTNATLNVEVYAGASSVFAASPSLPSLAGGTNATLTTGSYTPSMMENYMVYFNATSDQTDTDTTNNSGFEMFAITDSSYSRADSTVDGTLGIGAGTSGFLGNAYEIVTATELTSISFRLDAPTLGDTVYGAVYDMAGGTPNATLAFTLPIIISDTAASWYTLPIIGGALSLLPGTYVVGIQEAVDYNVTLGTNSAAYTPGTSWVFFSGSWGNNEDFSFFNSYNIIANVRPACVGPVAAFSDTATGLTATFTDASTSTGVLTSWAWDFGDGNTSTMQNPVHTYAAAGTYTVCLIASDSCATDTICQALNVTCVGPVAAFSDTATGLTATFTDASTSTGVLISWAWDFGDGNTSTMQNPVHTYTAAGTYTVCLIASDSCATDTICQALNVTGGVGIGENGLDNASIFPVPANQNVTVANLHLEGNFTLELFNSMGQVVFTKTYNGNNSVSFDVSGLPAGFYNLRLKSDQLNGIKPIVIR
jgi:PKD repeat protein